MTEFTLNAYSMIFSEHPMSEPLNKSNKILISSTVLPDIDMNNGTVLFELKTNDGKYYCGMHEYIDAPGLCFVPHKYITSLTEPTSVKIKQILDIPKGDFIKIKPFKTEFIEFPDPKSILEKEIVKNYPVLTKGEIIIITTNNTEYAIEIIETSPSEVIKTIDCDIKLEFEQPYDYVEKVSPPKTKAKNIKVKESDPRFPGIGRRLGSK